MPRKKKCKAPSCGASYDCEVDHPPFRNWCSTDCAIEIARARQDKARAKAAAKKDRQRRESRREWDRETRRRKVALRTRKDWEKILQRTFNDYIRARDYLLPCISCGKFHAQEWQGSMWDCGHFLSVGSHPELRFHEANAHRQHSVCNRGAAKSKINDKTMQAQYRERLIDRIGLDTVEWLEGPHDPLKLTVEEMEYLLQHYRRQIKVLSKLYNIG